MCRNNITNNFCGNWRNNRNFILKKMWYTLKVSFRLFDDKEKNMWHIKGNSAYLKGELGGIAHALVSKDTGQLIALWHTQ